VPAQCGEGRGRDRLSARGCPTPPVRRRSIRLLHFNGLLRALTIDEKRAVIGEISRVLKPGGTLVIKTPNRSYLAWVIRMKRVLAIASLQSPWIFIEHTRDNPDREHHGLTTYRELESLLDERLFVNVERVPLRLRRRRLPAWLSRRLFGFWPLTEHIILRCNHSVFVPLGDSLERRGA